LEVEVFGDLGELLSGGFKFLVQGGDLVHILLRLLGDALSFIFDLVNLSIFKLQEVGNSFELCGQGFNLGLLESNGLFYEMRTTEFLYTLLFVFLEELFESLNPLEFLLFLDIVKFFFYVSMVFLLLLLFFLVLFLLILVIVFLLLVIAIVLLGRLLG
jgi:hypothetical protein